MNPKQSELFQVPIGIDVKSCTAKGQRFIDFLIVCMTNRINNHNINIVSNEKDNEESTKTFNCRDRTSYPLKGKCPQKGVI